jgi:hypothetical protein
MAGTLPTFSFSASFCRRAAAFSTFLLHLGPKRRILYQ